MTTKGKAEAEDSGRPSSAGRRVPTPGVERAQPAAPMGRALLRAVCTMIVVLAAVEYVVATVGVQVRTVPVRSDFASYWLAGDLARLRRSPYPAEALAARGHQLGFAHDQYPFLYPPPFALAMQPLSRLPYERARALWVLLSSAFLFAAIALTGQLVLRTRVALALRAPHYAWVLLAAFVPAALNSSSVHNDVRSGSVGAILYFLFAVLLWSLASRRATLAGLALALATLVKLFPVALLPLVWWRGGPRAAATAAAVILAATALACIHWGPSILQSYVTDALLPLNHAHYVWPNNQSLASFFGRLLVGDVEIVAPVHAPLLAASLSVLLSVAIVVVTVLALVRLQLRTTSATHVDASRLGADGGLVGVELGCAVIAVLLVMKITWVHTLTSMLFVWPLVMLAVMRAAEDDAPWAGRLGALACVGFFLSSAHFPTLWGDFFKRWPGTALTGIHLAGLLLLWWCCVILLRRSLSASIVATAGKMRL